MTDYLAEALNVGALAEEVRRAERKPTAPGRDVEKQREKEHPLLRAVERNEAVFHRLRQPVTGTADVSSPTPATVAVPSFSDPGPLGTPAPFSNHTAEAPLRSFSDLEEVDRAVQRDSRRYDSGFFLY